MYELKLKKYNWNGELKENPYKKDFKEGQLSYIQGILMKEVEIGYEDKNVDIPYFYLKFIEVGGVELAGSEEKYRKLKIRSTKGIIKELSNRDIDIERITPLFDKDSEDLTELLEDKNLKYIQEEKEKLNQVEDEEKIYYEMNEDETFNYLVEIRRWDKLNDRPVRENYIVRELYDLLEINKE